MLKWILVALALFLAGCQSLVPNGGYDPALTAQQIKAITSDKNASVVCAQIPTPLGPAKTTIVNIDQRVIDNGGIAVNPDCQINFTTIKPPPKEK